ncbi:dienelactone hydrolase family protein [Pseudothauera lacus]|uniref:Alpha/beta hydrolase n=1 Tax=Pseudothauera lacus TaxID=2136175 RepID=A0A2T4IJL7_9RHOO|nr:alpha/beta hydrolase [Pseudothauera lacus]PTD97964.1 alpha/beta hydrolase [Pseudothauera lacus]
MFLRHTLIGIPTAETWLDALLCHAPDVHSLVIILHPTSTPAEASREDALSAALHAAGHATLAVDLLTAHEAARDPDTAFNMAALANRIAGVRDWIAHQPFLRTHPVAAIALGTACGAAVRALARDAQGWSALTCAGGRPDLAGAAPLRALRVPTRFIAASGAGLLAMQRQAHAMLQGEDHDWQEIAGDEEVFATVQGLALVGEHALAWMARHPEAPPPPVEDDPER